MAASVDERFKCAECGRIAASAANLRVHMRSHTGEKPYKCNVCGKCYAQPRNLKNHMGLHGEARPYQCSECPKNFVLMQALKDHQKSHSEDRPFRCIYCGRGFKYKDVLRSHLITHTGEGPLKCSECGMCYTTQSRLNQHMRSHTNERPYVCDVCGVGFTMNSALVRHKVLHTGDRKYECSVCRKKFIVPSDLRLHMQAHSGERHRCMFCRRSFKYKNVLQKHMRLTDAKGPQICSVCTKEFDRNCQLKEHMKTHKGRQVYNCTKCEKSFILLTHLNEHMRSHSASRLHRKCSISRQVAGTIQQKVAISPSEDGRVDFDIISEIENVINKKNEFDDTASLNTNNQYDGTNCVNTREKVHGYNDGTNFTNDAADLLSSTTGQVDQRLRQYTEDDDKSLEQTNSMAESVHFSNVSHSYQCSESEKNFRTKELLQGHTKTHAEEKPSVFNYHEKGLEHENAVETPLISHTDKEPHKCSICGMCFITPSKLQHHVMSKHTSDRPYICEICREGFKCNFELDKHKVVHTEDRNCRSTTCDKKFQVATELKSQEARVIPWDVGAQHSLIEKTREHRVLWDHSHELFSKKHLKRSAWGMVAAALRLEYPELAAASLNEVDVKEKFAKLKTSFQREVKKIHNTSSGSGSYDKVPKWEFFRSFSYMMPLDSKEHHRSSQVVECAFEPQVILDERVPTISEDDRLQGSDEDVDDPPLRGISNLPGIHSDRTLTPLPTSSTSSHSSAKTLKRPRNDSQTNTKELGHNTMTRVNNILGAYENSTDETADKTAELVRSFLHVVSEPQKKKLSLKIYQLLQIASLREDL